MSETFKSDVEIAAEADKKPITEIAARLGLCLLYTSEQVISREGIGTDSE